MKLRKNAEIIDLKNPGPFKIHHLSQWPAEIFSLNRHQNLIEFFINMTYDNENYSNSTSPTKRAGKNVKKIYKNKRKVP